MKTPFHMQHIERALGRAINLGETMDKLRRLAIEGPINPNVIDMEEISPGNFVPRKRTPEQARAANSRHTFGAFFRALDEASRNTKR